MNQQQAHSIANPTPKNRSGFVSKTPRKTVVGQSQKARKCSGSVSSPKTAGSLAIAGLSSVADARNETLPLTPPKVSPATTPEEVSSPLSPSSEPSHSMAQYIADLRKQGFTETRIRTAIRKTFPGEYDDLYTFLRAKASNTMKDGIEFDASLRTPNIVGVIFHLGFRPRDGQGNPYHLDRITARDANGHPMPYALWNVRFVPANFNQDRRGDSELVDAYRKDHKISRATAYRHLRQHPERFDYLRPALPIPDGEAMAYDMKARDLWGFWMNHLEIYHPAVHHSEQSFPSPKDLKRIERAIKDRNAQTLRDAMFAALAEWPKVRGEAIKQGAYGVGTSPFLDTFLNNLGKFIFAANQIKAQEAKAKEEVARMAERKAQHEDIADLKPTKPKLTPDESAQLAFLESQVQAKVADADEIAEYNALVAKRDAP